MDEQSMMESIRRLRMASGYTQEQAAEALHISRGSIAHIENGKVRIVNANVTALAALLGVSLEELLLGFQPERDAVARLRETEEEYDARFKSLREEWEGKVDKKADELATLRELVESQKATIRTQEEMISMLRSRIPEENA